ncbi:hypothetical protein FKW77_010292 [Venturia effusa]|uniref:Hydrophobin n=1 Tax=Venturia effusa TaxID=50376 RepID=A0A517L0E5_9PEZI|nr:hypothetical protein FKW77_010292 [Venturia effusa]
MKSTINVLALLTTTVLYGSTSATAKPYFCPQAKTILTCCFGGLSVGSAVGLTQSNCVTPSQLAGDGTTGLCTPTTEFPRYGVCCTAFGSGALASVPLVGDMLKNGIPADQAEGCVAAREFNSCPAS